MKLALINDTHFGARAESPVFNEYFFKFWDNIFFPYLEKHNIKQIIHLGDAVDRRKFINYVIMHNIRTRFIDRIGSMGIKMDVIVGNHDVPYRNTNTINAFEEMFGTRDFINVVSSPITKNYDGLDVALLPWINSSNQKETEDLVANTTAQIAFGHLEIAGFEMDKGSISLRGLDREFFKKFEAVYSGHFHHKSTDGHIFYLGNQYEITWVDFDDKRGFHVYDTDTREVEYIVNPYHMFHKIEYNDLEESLESVDAKDLSIYKGTNIKVVVINKDNPVLFDRFMDKLHEVEPHDVDVVEDFMLHTDESEESIIDQSDTTTVIVDKVIDTLETGVNKDRLKAIIKQIYNEAQDLEVT